MEQTQITPELYEQVKAMVLAEQKATAKARAAERAERYKALTEEEKKAQAMFDATRIKYTPLLVERYKNTFVSGNRPIYELIEARLTEATNMALRTLGYRNALDAYRDNKAQEANQIAGEILDAMIKQ